jgi:carbonic anhydrase
VLPASSAGGARQTSTNGIHRSAPAALGAADTHPTEREPIAMSDIDNDQHKAGLIGLLQGVSEFSQHVFPDNEALFSSLAKGQAPHTLFITCADSRVVPEMITQTQPGELFVCRNIGNIVPGYGEMLGGVSAVVEYAVMALGIQFIVVCGHTDCGAMKGLCDGTASLNMPTVEAWLRNAEAARSVVMTRHMDRADAVQALVEENIKLQLTHLRTHPSVAARMAEGRLELQGWIYDIEHGQVRIYHEAEGRFQSLDEATARIEQRDVA